MLKSQLLLLSMPRIFSFLSCYQLIEHLQLATQTETDTSRNGMSEIGVQNIETASNDVENTVISVIIFNT